VATPMHMMAPVRAGTLSVVPVMSSIQAMPAMAAGSAVMMMRDPSRTGIDDDEQVHQQHGSDHANRQAGVGAEHGLHLAAQHDVRGLGQRRVDRAQPRVDVVRHGAQVAVLYIAIDVDEVLGVVMVDDGGVVPRVKVATPPRICARVPEVTGTLRQVIQRRSSVLRGLRHQWILQAVFRVQPERGLAIWLLPDRVSSRCWPHRAG